MVCKVLLVKTIDSHAKNQSLQGGVFLNFFILFVITSLSLLLSTFAHDFTQLFSIFNKHFYRPLIFFLYVCGVFMSLIYLILCAWHKNHALIPQIVAFIGGYFHILVLYSSYPYSYLFIRVLFLSCIFSTRNDLVSF